MIQIFTHPYRLRPQASLNAKAQAREREGSLLKVVWPDGSVGYSCLQPWPELGDADLRTHLLGLTKGDFSSLVEQSLWMARADAKLRQKGQSAFSDGVSVDNNLLVTDVGLWDLQLLQQKRQEGFASAKVKIGPQFEQTIELLNLLVDAGFTLRLDMNSTLTASSFEGFMKELGSEVQKAIEYVEDPFPFHEHQWREASRLIPLAVDQEYSRVSWDDLVTPPFQVLVVKPARVDVDKAVHYCQKWNLKMTVTSSMEHPLGVLQSLAVAMRLKKKYPQWVMTAGCFTHHLYEADEFSSRIETQGPRILPPDGGNVGFDDLLEELEWRRIQVL